MRRDEHALTAGDRGRDGLVVEQAGERVELVDEGVHALAKQSRVPLIELRVPEGLWLMNRAGLLQLEHLYACTLWNAMKLFVSGMFLLQQWIWRRSHGMLSTLLMPLM